MLKHDFFNFVWSCINSVHDFLMSYVYLEQFFNDTRLLLIFLLHVIMIIIFYKQYNDFSTKKTLKAV